MNKKYKLAKLNDKNGRILTGKKNRWYLEYSVFDEQKGKVVRKRLYQINNIESLTARYEYARKSIAQINQHLKDGYILNSKEKLRIFEVLEKMLEVKKQTLRQRSFETYSSTVSLYKKHMEDEILTYVKVSEILKFRDFLLKNRKNSTVNSCIGHISTLLSEAQKRGHISENPCKKVPKLKEEISFRNKAFTKKVREIVIKEVRQDPQLWLTVRLLFYCFIRPSEIMRLKVCHFDIKNQQIFIPSSISKNGKSEYVTIPSVLNKALYKEFEFLNSDDYVVSANGRTTPYSKNVMSQRHRLILTKLKMKGQFTLYSWKHTGVVEAYKNGVDIKSLQLQCRHHSLDMTDIYLKSLGLYLNKAILTKMPDIGDCSI